MGVTEWSALATAAAGFLALWVRLGRILQRFDDLGVSTKNHATILAKHERRLTALELRPGTGTAR